VLILVALKIDAPELEDSSIIPPQKSADNDVEHVSKHDQCPKWLAMNINKS